MAKANRKAVTAAPKASKRAKHKASQKRSILELARAYKADEDQLSSRQRIEVEDWAFGQISRGSQQILRSAAVGVALRHLESRKNPPAPIPLEKQHAVILQRLAVAKQRLSDADLPLAYAVDALRAIETLAYESQELISEDREEKLQRAHAAGIRALAKSWGDTLMELSEKLQDLSSFRAEVTAADVAELEQSAEVQTQ